VLLLASSAQTGPTFTRCGVCGYAGPLFRDVTRGLLQRYSCWGIQVYHRQAPASMNAAARVVSDTRKYDRRLTNLLYDELHWLDVPERVQYKLCTTVHRCLQNKAPKYMEDCCVHTSNIARRQHLRSAGCRQLLMPRHRRSMFGRRAFSVAGPEAWNSLPDYLRDPACSVDSFRRDLKTFLFSLYQRAQRIRGFAITCYINLLY